MKRAKKPKATMGRPPFRPSDRRSLELHIRITEAERASLRRQANATDQTLANYVRAKLGLDVDAHRAE